MEKLADDFLVLLVDGLYVLVFALLGYIIYNIQERLEKKRNKKRGRVKYLAKIKEGEVT